MEMNISVVLMDIFIGSLILVVLSWVLVAVQTFIDERKRDKREAAAEIRAQESAKREAERDMREQEYHQKRMEELCK